MYGLIGGDVVMQVRFLSLMLCLCCCVSELQAELDEYGWLQLTSDDGRLVIDAEINDVPTKLMFDTGSSINAISASLVTQAGIAVKKSRSISVRGAFDETDINLSGDFKLKLGDVEVNLTGFPIVQSSSDIILGRDIFQRMIVQVDYPNNRMRLLEYEQMQFSSNIKYKIGAGDAPLVRASVNGKRAWLLLDTGNSGLCVLTRKCVQRHDLDEYQLDGVKASGEGVHRQIGIQLLQLPELQLGPYTFEGFLAGYANSENDGLDGEINKFGSLLQTSAVDFDGVLGYEILRNFIITMKLGDQMVHLAAP